MLADRIMVMRPRPGRIYDEIECDLPRPRDRQSAAFDFVKRRVLAALDRSLDRAVTRRRPRDQGRRRRGDVVVTAAPLSMLRRSSLPSRRAWLAYAMPRCPLGSLTTCPRKCDAKLPGLPLRRSRCSCNEQPTPKPAGTEVLLKVLAAGVCHSDLHLSDGYFDLGGGKRLSLPDRGMKLPVTLGHENVGEVVAVGPAGARASRSATGGWRIPGSAAAPARSASAARSISAAPCRASACSRNGGYSRLSDGAASALSVRHRRSAAGARRAARLLGRHHLRRAEEGRPDAEDRADGDHRRRRARPDVPCAAQGDGRPQRHRGRHRSGQARGGEEGRRATR